MIYFISDSDIISNDLELSILNKSKENNSCLYLTATQNLKHLRATSSYLSDIFITSNGNKAKADLYSFTEFSQSISKKIYASKECISASDQRYVLSKSIDYYYDNNHFKAQPITQMRNELYELYSLIIFNDKKISDNQLSLISKDFSNVEVDIFAIYKLYKSVLDDLLDCVSSKFTSTLLVDVLGKDFLKNSKVINVNLFSKKQKELIQKEIENYDVVFLDGFLFLNELQRVIIKTALNHNKSIVFISKQFEDNTGAFIFESSIAEIASEYNIQIIKAEFNKKRTEIKSALEYAKMDFPVTNLMNTYIPHSEDDSIEILPPFINREEELRYISRNISKLLKGKYNKNCAELIQAVNNDIAIVLAINKEEYEERISNLFKDVGLFIYNKEKEKSKEFTNINENSFEMIYFERKEFLFENILDNNGNTLDYTQKYEFFDKYFMRIDINRTSRPIASFPIGQFVLEIYNIVLNGISIDGFKNILYSNWKYNTDQSQVKWSEFISDFKFIEMYLENKLSLDEWLKTALELRELKNQINNNPLYTYHPLKQIKDNSLIFFELLIVELLELVNQVSSIVGNVNNHIDTLKKVVMRADNILNKQEDTLEHEQLIIKRLVNAISDIGTNSIIDNLDAKFFAQNIRAMLTEWENQVNDESTIRLNIVNLENMQNYKYCYFPMCEANKYPRPYYEKFPFTPDIVNILSNQAYGINIDVHELKGLEYHLNLEKYLFKNVLDFTRKKLTFTYCEKENGNYNKPSIYLKDIELLFDKSTFCSTPQHSCHNYTAAFQEKILNYYLEPRTSYTLTELAIFKLCPKLYFHTKEENNCSAYLSSIQLKFYFEAILYCETLKRFMDYNLENKKVYKKSSSEHISIIENLFHDSYRDNTPFFSFFSMYELQDIKRNVQNKITGYIDNAIKNLKGSAFTVITHTNKKYNGDEYELIVEHDNRVVDYDFKTWRMGQSSNYLEFLVLKTSDKTSDLKHYADMVKALNQNDSDTDRVNLVSRIIAKINIQFDSGKYANDGIKRSNELVKEINNYDFSNAQAMNSDYCTYCRLNDICMKISNR